MGFLKVVSGLTVAQPVTMVQPQNRVGAQPAPREVTLEGTPNDAQLRYWADWDKEVVSGKLTRQDVIIIAHDASGREVRRWTLTRAFPTKLSYGSLAAQSNALTMSVTLAYETIMTSL